MNRNRSCHNIQSDSIRNRSDMNNEHRVNESRLSKVTRTLYLKTYILWISGNKKLRVINLYHCGIKFIRRVVYVRSGLHFTIAIVQMYLYLSLSLWWCIILDTVKGESTEDI